MTTIGGDPIALNLARVRERIGRAAERSGREANEIRLVGVSKTFPPSAIVSAVQAGLTDVGENWVQEAVPKAAAVAAAGLQPTWNLIGHLQTNKVGTALKLFHCIQSVDSLHLAEALSRRAEGSVAIFVEVNVAAEASKTGFTLFEAAAAIERIATMPNLVLRGLMTVAPLVSDPELVRPVFRSLKALAAGLGLEELSMGMSVDYEVAIAEGATMVRIGRAIFGSRQ